MVKPFECFGGEHLCEFGACRRVQLFFCQNQMTQSAFLGGDYPIFFFIITQVVLPRDILGQYVIYFFSGNAVGAPYPYFLSAFFNAFMALQSEKVFGGNGRLVGVAKTSTWPRKDAFCPSFWRLRHKRSAKADKSVS